MAHADAALGADPKLAWLGERAQLDRANKRVASGRSCWSGIVARYKQGK